MKVKEVTIQGVGCTSATSTRIKVIDSTGVLTSVMDVSDDGSRIFIDNPNMPRNQDNKCKHQYSKSMNQPTPRLCTKCGEPEFLGPSDEGYADLINDA
jgi:hypothetical protein